jgi:flagellar biosynthesis/type III secretory pathway protein FliH
MYYDNTLNKIKKFGLILSLMIGFLVISVTSTQAQWRDRDRDDNDRYSRDYRDNAMKMARERGYRDGFNEGRDDARDGDRYRPQASNYWERGTDGYDNRWGNGNRNSYRQVYRSAYMQGYRAGYYQRNNRNNRSFNVRIF